MVENIKMEVIVFSQENMRFHDFHAKIKEEEAINK